MTRVLITGAGGQLGQCLHTIANSYPGLELVFLTREDLDLEDREAVRELFQNQAFDFCINAAAFTPVDAAEQQRELAFRINATAAGHLAEVCAEAGTTLIQISTDYVFNGRARRPYRETDLPDPINAYGASKWEGEEQITASLSQHYIIRVSWLYSQFGSNFYTKVRQLASERKEIHMTDGEYGSPTHAADLSHFLLGICKGRFKAPYGRYHFCNTGAVSRFDFAAEILKLCPECPGPKLFRTDNYVTFAQRPKYSVLDTAKTQNQFHVALPNWKESLQHIQTGAFVLTN